MHGKVSLIIPVKDEEGSIGALLDSVKAQTRPPDEIVITDGGSRDRTVAIIESYRGRGEPIRLIAAGRAYPGKARNLAIESSRYDWIAMTDAGMRLDRQWLAELLRPFGNGDSVDVVYGTYEPVTDSFFKECLALVFIPASEVRGGRRMRSRSVASCALKKTVWAAVGGFPDLRAAEDRIFMERIEEKGFRIGFSPDAKVFWSIPHDLRSVFRRFSLYAFHDLKAGRFGDWHLPVFIMYLAGGLACLAGMAASPVWYILLACGIAARAAGLIVEKSREKKFSFGFVITRLWLVAALMIWIDLAMFYGTAQFLIRGFSKGVGQWTSR